jgi:hypothetical protein
MKKETSADPIMGPTEHKVPTHVCIKHADLPGLDEAALGDRVKIIVTGKIISNRAADEYGDGTTDIEVTSIENVDPVKKENAATMHLDKLKSKIVKKEEPEEEANEADDSEEEEKDEEKDA